MRTMLSTGYKITSTGWLLHKRRDGVSNIVSSDLWNPNLDCPRCNKEILRRRKCSWMLAILTIAYQKHDTHAQPEIWLKMTSSKMRLMINTKAQECPPHIVVKAWLGSACRWKSTYWFCDDATGLTQSVMPCMHNGSLWFYISGSLIWRYCP